MWTRLLRLHWIQWGYRIAALWAQHALTRHSAALAFFSLLTLTPLLVVLAGVGGYFLGSERIVGRILEGVEQALGEGAAQLVHQMIAQTLQRGSGATATLVGFILAFWGASGLLQALKDSLDTLWESPPHAESGLLHWFIARLIATGGVLLLVLLLALSLLLEVVLVSLQKRLPDTLPGIYWLGYGLNRALTPLVLWVGIALFYWWLPARRPRFREALIGALVATVLVVGLRGFVSWYLATTGIATLYGSAGSVVVLLLGVYFGAQAFLLGAAVCVVVSKRP